MNVLALEVSTSSAKAIAYSSEEGILYSDSIPYGRSVGSITSQNPDGVYNTVLECGHNVVKAVDCKIDIIALASTWHSFLMLDKDRKPVDKIRTWANTEASATASKYRQDDEFSHYIYQKTGCPVHSIYPLWKWMYLKSKMSFAGQVYISSKAEYIFEKLTGEIAVSKSTASGTGFMNINTLEWDEDILKFAGLKKEQLSPLYEYDYTGCLVKTAADRMGLAAGIPVVITGPDGGLNQIGSGALKEGMMTLSVGTSGALRLVTPRVLLPEKPSTWCYYLLEDKRLAGAATSGAGNCIDWFMKNINNENLGYEQLDQLASDIKRESAPIFLPFLYGERCPGWQDNRTGGFFNMKGSHKVGHLYYAVLEGILFNLFHSYRILVGVGSCPEEIRVSGGINNSGFWLQMLADILQREIYISSVKDASTMGAVAVAEEIMGTIKDLKNFDSLENSKKIPEPGKKLIYKKRFTKYINYYNMDKEK
ncbi:MAG: gluconokinase [Halanaerobiaceae bacterium]